MLKALGLSLIFICSVGIGFYSSVVQKTALEQAKEMLDFMYYIKNQIEYFNMPLNEIYSSFEEQSRFSSSLVKDISTKGWTHALRKQKKLLLPSPCISIINDFGNTLGKTERKDQLEKCDYYIKEFEQEYENLKEVMPKKTKTSFALCIYVGLMIIILFI